MGYQTVELGLTLTIPTSGTRNWAATILTGAWQVISEHAHTGSGDGNQIPTAGLEDESVTTEKLAPAWGVQKATAAVPAGTTVTLDMQSALVFPIDLGSASGNVTVTFLNPETGATYRIISTQGATPLEFVFGGVLWENGEAPILSTGEDEIDIIELYYDGSTFYGRWSNNYV
jgi:hypothetical protein